MAEVYPGESGVGSRGGFRESRLSRTVREIVARSRLHSSPFRSRGWAGQADRALTSQGVEELALCAAHPA